LFLDVIVFIPPSEIVPVIPGAWPDNARIESFYVRVIVK